MFLASAGELDVKAVPTFGLDSSDLDANVDAHAMQTSQGGVGFAIRSLNRVSDDDRSTLCLRQWWCVLLQ